MQLEVFSSVLSSFRTFVFSVLEADPPTLSSHFDQALRKVASGLGNWATQADLTHLKHYLFPAGCFQDPKMVSKVRVVEDVAPDCHSLRRRLVDIQGRYFHRPF